MGLSAAAVAVLAAATCDCSAAARTAVADHRMQLDGRATFPLGTFVHGLDESDWRYLAASGFNCVMTYTNGIALPAGVSFNSSTLDLTQDFLDAAERHGMGVFLSLKDYYDCCHLGPGLKPQPDCCHGFSAKHYDELVAEIVRRFKTHKALWGWYLNDEYHPDMIPLVAARFDQVMRLDGRHVTYSGGSDHSFSMCARVLSANPQRRRQ